MTTIDKWLEQKDATTWVRWGVIGEDDDRETTHVVKKDAELIGKIEAIRPSHTYEGKVILTVKLDDGKEVNFLAPIRLQNELGLNPMWHSKYRAKEGDEIKIIYLGKDKETDGNPHKFKVFFANNGKNK